MYRVPGTVLVLHIEHGVVYHENDAREHDDGDRSMRRRVVEKKVFWFCENGNI